MAGPLLQDAGGATNGFSSSPSPSSPIDPQILIEYLSKVIQIVLGGSEQDISQSLLSPQRLPDSLARCKRFAQESNLPLYIRKEDASVLHPDGSEEDADIGPSYVYNISTEVAPSRSALASLVVLKHRAQPLDASSDLSAQVEIISLPGSTSLSSTTSSQSPGVSPYEVLYAILNSVISPYFDASTKPQEQRHLGVAKGFQHERAGIPDARKKIEELKLSFQHLQSNVEIPELHLDLHPMIVQALEEADRNDVRTIDALSLIPSNVREDDQFLNGLQTVVNSWIKAIQKITKTTRDPENGTARQEVNFWLEMESRLDGIEEQLRGNGVALTMEVLKVAKRFQATTSFSADTGLKERMDEVRKYNQLMREFPLDDLNSATSLARVRDAIDQIFTHLNKKLRISPYPIKRALPLVSAISADLDSRIHALLQGRTLMHLEFPQFDAVLNEAESIWRTWDECAKEFTNVARDVIRRRNEKFISIKIKSKHEETQKRLRYVHNFRKNHEQLQLTIKTVLGASSSALDGPDNAGNNDAVIVAEIGDVDAVEEVAQAYAALKDVDVLDVSEEGNRIWGRAEETYNERTARVENSIIARLRDRLAVAKTANEKFRVFSKFNALFVRPKIRSAIHEYQDQLIKDVDKDVEALHNRFKRQYGSSQASMMAQIRDIPPVAGAIMWAQQIEEQLNGYMRKMEDILGSEWHLHAVGQKFQRDAELFRKKLDTRPVFEAWVQDVQRRELAISGRIFTIRQNRKEGNILEIHVNFDQQIIVLFKEVRNLQWRGFQVPHMIGNLAKDAKRVYPYAVRLMESLRTHAQTVRKIESMDHVAILLNSFRDEAQDQVKKGVPLKWESFVHAYDIHIRHGMTALDRSGRGESSKHVQFVSNFEIAVNTLQEKTATLSAIDITVQKAMQDLETCPYNLMSFRKNLEIIQKAVDQLNFEQFVNLPFWVRQMNARIELILLDRLKRAIAQWKDVFENKEDEHPGDGNKEEQPQLTGTVHEISLRNSVIYLNPPLEFARASWLAQLHEWLAIVCTLKKIEALRYEMRLEVAQSGGAPEFSELPSLCADTLMDVYNTIEYKLAGMSAYVGEWLRFQSLWDLQSDQVYAELGEDLGNWLQLLQDIKKSRSTFDTTETTRSFGYATVDYGQVQNKVNQKFDQWQQEILGKFAGRLQHRMSEVFVEIEKARKDLEVQSLETSSTAQAVAFITTVQQCRRKVKGWGSQVEIFSKGEKNLKRQRYPLPQDWLNADQIEHEWAAMNEILARKSKLVADQSDALKAKITAEDNVVGQKIRDIQMQWNEERPVSGSIPPEEAMATLQAFASKLNVLQNEALAVSKAKEALDLPATVDSSLGEILGEVEDFQSLWANLSTIWNSISDLRENLWTSIQPRKLRQSLDNLIKLTKDLPPRMKGYAAYEHLQNVLRQHLKAIPLLSDLRSDAIRERHWNKIFKTLRPTKRYSQLSMTLGDVWDLQPLANETAIRDVIIQAQGEMGLEEYLRQVRDTWTEYSLELVNYHNKCRLIRGWDDLFAKCSDNLNSLQAMRHSPYYKEFEEEASGWEEKLNRVHVLFDVWIDVQRQWVYLEGVFSGNADIKHLLPIESNRFGNINTEFLAVMKKVSKSPNVMDVLAISGVQQSLERLADLLNKIQKALGEYLERERMSFPRFYFVGDEDLLEIIGNSNDTSRISKHLKKMFAGISGLIVDSDSNITGFTSREGERVSLKKEISLIKTPKINEWLGALESNMKSTLAELVAEAVQEFTSMLEQQAIDPTAFDSFINSYPAQAVVLATQIRWTMAVEQSLGQGGSNLEDLFNQQVSMLQHLATTVLGELDPLQRKTCEHLITEFVHQRDVIHKLQKIGASSVTHPMWLVQMRFVYHPEGDFEQRIKVKMANAVLDYGFEYLGVPERLVRTPLTDRCFLTLTQALCQRLGGSPYGPAGTGKTESVKALGLQLGRFTLVFCCDDTFDFQAMGRIFLGICQVGAWGCFDEFNRLEERILSAVSQQVQNIQLGLKKGTPEKGAEIELIGRNFAVNSNTGIFITMNPGYAGRSNLPDNLKKLFRSVAMSKPDKELIAEVMLYSQGFSQAKGLSKQVVPFFDKCGARLSKQSHYDFGLRALKSVLVSSGGLKRARLALGNSSPNEDVLEPQIIVQSLRETMAPKLIQSDAEIMQQIETEAFPGVEYVPASLEKLQDAIKQVAAEKKLVVSDTWMTKIIQLYQIQNLHHGVMMVGSSGAGKSSAWRTLLQALQQVEGVEGVCHVIDPKVMSKEDLYGSLDSTTREWTDGLFTGILRKIVDNLRGEDQKRHWIVFDGDVDPEWVENLNSVLDDNKLLTLPNGERLNLPQNVRIMFEVETLRYATLATVSRCGMVWFSDDTVSIDMMLANYVSHLRTVAFDDVEDDSVAAGLLSQKLLQVQGQVADMLEIRLTRDGVLQKALSEARRYKHIMEYTDIRALNTLFSLLNKSCRSVLEYNAQHSDFPLDPEQIEAFVSKKLLLALVWSLTGDCPLSERKRFGDYVAQLTTMDMPLLTDTTSLIDFDVTLPRADWVLWQSQVPSIEVNTHSVTETDRVIPTIDTVRHEDVLYSWLAEHKPLLLCGPPGSGKTMTLFNALRKLPDMVAVGLNFSSATTPDLLIKTLEERCDYKKTLNGVVLTPKQIGRWVVIFCDEINLPAPDKYGTQRAITFLRQLVEQNGFWRTSDKSWVTLERIQFVGACNPPTDAGRTPMGLRFLRHAPLIMVDYPGETSLLQIYGTFNNAILKIVPTLRGYSEPLTKAMVQLYLESQKRFTPDIQPHYVYSPRELTRWIRGVYEAIKPLETLSVEGLVRIWAHEALRLFQDRLIDEEERKWTDECVHRVALENFPTIDEQQALGGPILFSQWLHKDYVPVDREQLRDYVKERLKTFCEEEVDVPLILFNDVLENVLRIDRVFRQPQGHLILIGTSGSGKTTLSRFVAWINGLKVYQIKVHGKYSAEDFDDDLRNVLRRCGCKGEKICFIMDESNVLDSGFLERMNTLLANAEVPGLFEGDEYAALMTACREGAQRQGLLLDSQDELYKWFTQQIVNNLHVVFTMNPPEDGLSSKAATSPALFNRCVLNWFGDWSDQALYQVGSELTQRVDLDRATFIAPDSIPVAYRSLSLPASHRDTVVNAMVYVHHSLHHYNNKLQKQQNKSTYLTPRHFLDFVNQFVKLYNEKREDLEEQQRHLNVGLDKLRETFDKVRDLRKSLAEKQGVLERKNIEANEKLQRMVSDQQEAERRKTASLQQQAALEKKEQEIAERKQIVQESLDRAEPAVEEAKRSVNNIKRQHLTEVRSMQTPPQAVRMALEAVCTLLGHKATDWKAIQGIIRRDDFIGSIVNYDNERQMTKNHRTKMRNEYLSKDDFNYERVNRASKACGPLVQWVEAQVEYSEILNSVGPLREEVAQLEQDAVQTREEAAATEHEVNALQSRIEQFKREYATLISETEAIKSEMTRVQSKVDRSVRLLDSLSSEQSRWETGSKSFETQIDTIVGDVLVAAAFIAYGGYYDQQYRKSMMEDWLHHLSMSGIRFKTPNPITEYLSTADERLKWQENSLQSDDLSTENAIILKRFNRYPLIIDPSGRVTEFLQNESKERRLIVTSFLDDSFTKQLESSLRFGNSILIQDAEHLDPILNHVLNKEYQRTGGRVLIQLGKQEIDFSPSFRLFLSTRDPSANFAPDICSRTTFVNFTVTQSSLQTQTLNEVLKSERPDVDERRSNLIKMQGEFSVHLRRLEKRLLQALNESQGNILDDDNVIKTLETLKKEAADITAKVSETEGVMAEVDKITLEYSGIARSCAAIFAVLQEMHHINHFYQFSLQYFIDIFEAVLTRVRNTPHGESHASRIDTIIRHLFVDTYRRASLSLLQKDRVALAMLLVQAAPFKMDKSLIDRVLDKDSAEADVSTNPDRKDSMMDRMSKMPLFKNDYEGVPVAAWDMFFSEEFAENHVPEAWPADTEPFNKSLRSLILIKLFRVDRFIPAVERFVSEVFGKGLLNVSGDLEDVVKEVSSTIPIALSSTPGFDASYKVDNLVEKLRTQCTNIAMGSNEGVASADKAISNAAAQGSWVLVKNVHLAPLWLQSLEKRIDSLKPHRDFRLFLSMETSPKIPVNLLRASRVLMYEQPAGVRANMKDSLATLASRATQQPVERSRVYLLLAFLHAVVQERLRYAPALGWKGFWEFNDSDYECCAFIIDRWIETVSHGRTNIAPKAIPWEMIRMLVTEMYGGKIDSEQDFAILSSIVEGIMTPAAFEEGFLLVKERDLEGQVTGGLELPSSAQWSSFVKWVDELPEREPPTYLGLPANAEKLLLVNQAKDVIGKLGTVMDLLDEGERVMAEAEVVA